jgi:hypothetical protein
MRLYANPTFITILGAMTYFVIIIIIRVLFPTGTMKVKAEYHSETLL